MTRRGIDVASWQHPNGAPIDWRAVAGDGVQWVGIKLTEDTHYVNPFAHDDIAGAHAAGLEVVVYHFLRPHGDTPERQAAFFQFIAGRVDGIDGYALDVEDGANLGHDGLGLVCSRFLDATRVDLAYYNLEYSRLVGDMFRFRGVREWVAAPSQQTPPAGAAVWQRQQIGVPGIAGLVDSNDVFYDGPVNAGPPVVPAPVDNRPPFGAEPVLRQGAAGPAVVDLQTALTRTGFPAAADGQFGPATRIAVMHFQHAHNLSVDGVVGPVTWRALGVTR